MRILGGELAGHRFNPPLKKWPTRPTTDISKEALFNILQNKLDFAELRILDLFGGTGNHSFEWASRGCQDVTYVDQYFGCVQYVKSQSKKWELENQITIIKKEAKRYISQFSDAPFDFIFCDPPYALKWLDEIPDLIFDKSMLTENGTIVIEHDQNNDFSTHQNYISQRKYGQSVFSFFE